MISRSKNCLDYQEFKTYMKVLLLHNDSSAEEKLIFCNKGSHIELCEACSKIRDDLLDIDMSLESESEFWQAFEEYWQKYVMSEEYMDDKLELGTIELFSGGDFKVLSTINMEELKGYLKEKWDELKDLFQIGTHVPLQMVTRGEENIDSGDRPNIGIQCTEETNGKYEVKISLEKEIKGELILECDGVRYEPYEKDDNLLEFMDIPKGIINIVFLK